MHKHISPHGNFDHMGEAINLVNNFKVEKVIFNCGPYNDLEQELIEVLAKKKIPYYSCIKELNIDNNKLYNVPNSISNSLSLDAPCKSITNLILFSFINLLISTLY